MNREWPKLAQPKWACDECATERVKRVFDVDIRLTRLCEFCLEVSECTIIADRSWFWMSLIFVIFGLIVPAVLVIADLFG